MRLSSGHNVEILEGEELTRYTKDWTGYTNGLVRLNPGSLVCQNAFLKFADMYYNFEFVSSDVVIVAFPKCGTTWTQEIVWTMRNNPDLDNPNASLFPLIKVPFLDYDTIMGGFFDGPSSLKHPLLDRFNEVCPEGNVKEGVCLQLANATPKPRTIKTHLPFSLLPPSLLQTCKVIYVCRNPKDMLVSYFHHCRILKLRGFTGTFDDFIQYFINDRFVNGNFASHVREAWLRRHHPNLHFIFYEDLKSNTLAEVKRLDAFLGTRLSPQQMCNVIRHTHFSEMKSRNEQDTDNVVFNEEIMKSDGGFFRKGQVGDWRNKLSDAATHMIDDWIRNNLADVGLTFKYSS